MKFLKKYFLLALICLWGFTVNPDESSAAPEYNLVATTLQGQNFDLQKMRGKVVVVMFWAQWCPNCTSEMMVLENLYKSYHQHGLEIIGFSVDPKKSLSKVKSRIANVTYSNAMLIDAKINNFPEVESIPTTYIFDRSGALHEVIHSAGALDKKLFEKLLLAKPLK